MPVLPNKAAVPVVTGTGRALCTHRAALSHSQRCGCAEVAREEPCSIPGDTENHRMEWFGLKMALKLILFQPLPRVELDQL